MSWQILVNLRGNNKQNVNDVICNMLLDWHLVAFFDKIHNATVIAFIPSIF